MAGIDQIAASGRVANHSSDELSETLRKAISKLSPTERRIIEAGLFDDRELTSRELGDELGVSSDSFRVLKFRALTKLRAELQKLGICISKPD